MVAGEKAFVSVLRDSVCESIIDTLGKGVLSVLVSRGLLDNVDNPSVLETQLSSAFGKGYVMLEIIIVKGLYEKLRIPYDSTLRFDYRKALALAKDTLFFGDRRR